MNFIKNFRLLTALVVAAPLLVSCATPKRGDPEYAPVMPVSQAGPVQHNDSIYQSGSAWLLLEDIKPRRVGDMLTVTLQEQTDAKKKAETDTTQSTSNIITPPTLLGGAVTHHGREVFETQVSSEHAFDGGGQSKQSNSLTGNVTVTVVQVLANGNLVVQGEKWININQGEEYIRLRGIVRPSDISPDNTISSIRVANAQIQYSGDSYLADSNEPGWLSKFFSSKWMPF
ncbi:MAG: flagellar basal body L-ring protein FlgH [Gammaproteobacteria bacterium]|nr:flagellar basal body L-ring protein FlgH [Gammaproteobacteria bacterium]